MRAFACIAIAFAVLIIVALATSCAPTPNKLAPEPPYAGTRVTGLDQAEYLRIEEPLDAR